MNILPVVKVHTKLYFADTRLKQYRSVVPHPEIIEFIPFGQESWTEDDEEFVCWHNNFEPELGCPDCHFTEVIAGKR